MRSSVVLVVLGAVLLVVGLVACAPVPAPAPAPQEPTAALSASQAPPAVAPVCAPGDCRVGARKPPRPVEPDQNATVTKVTDGDTIHVRLDSGDDEDVRILGIDTPETKKPRTPVKCGGPEASAYAAKVIGVGARVRIVGDGYSPDQDRYYRKLRYVTEPNGTDYSLDVITRGGGRFAEYGSQIVRHDQYAQAFAAAQAAHRGIWGPPCNGNSY